MADFINREEAVNFARSSAGAAYNRDDFYAYRALKDFIVTLISIPAADVVEVVRCKDCKHLLQDLSEREAHLCMRNRFERVGVSLDDFCSYGKRRE